jgi:hypothetical protein
MRFIACSLSPFTCAPYSPFTRVQAPCASGTQAIAPSRPSGRCVRGLGFGVPYRDVQFPRRSRRAERTACGRDPRLVASADPYTAGHSTRASARCPWRTTARFLGGSARGSRACGSSVAGGSAVLTPRGHDERHAAHGRRLANAAPGPTQQTRERVAPLLPIKLDPTHAPPRFCGRLASACGA